MSTCGGCEGKGAHTRWCINYVGIAASKIGLASEEVEDIADRIGAIDPIVTNDLYEVAGNMRQRANQAKNSHFMLAAKRKS